MDAETFLFQLESCTEFESLNLLLDLFSDNSNFPAERLFRAVSTQLDRFWLPDWQTVEHEYKQYVLDSLCWLLEHYMTESPVDVVDLIEGETLEKLFRSMIPFLVLNFDDFTDESDWTPECVYLKSLLWQFDSDYDDVRDKYKQNQTKLLTTIIGLMEKVNETPENEFNLLPDTYSSVQLKDRFMDALAYILGRFEWCELDLMKHIEFDQVLFACYRFMQPYEGKNLWSRNLESLGRVRSLVRYIADKLSSEIFGHFTLIESDLANRKLKLGNSVVLVQYLETLNLVPVDSEILSCTLQSTEQNNSIISGLFGFW